LDLRRLQARAKNAQKQSKSRLEQRMATEVAGIKFDEEIDGVRVISYQNWLNEFYPNWEMEEPNPEKVDKHLFKWCQKKKIHFYSSSEPNLEVATKQAKGLKRRAVLVKGVN
jgi:hypothetical protein